MKRVHIFYSGQVQGVGFRFTAERIATSSGITGWIKNLRDGRVEIIAEGDENQLGNFLNEVDSSFKNYIKNRDVDWQEATGEFKDFRIGF